jgi:hypothetical protein
VFTFTRIAQRTRRTRTAFTAFFVPRLVWMVFADPTFVRAIGA